MTPFSHIRNEAGFTLVELIVTLALSSVVLLTVVTGALFVERFVRNWSDRDRLDEEAVFVCDEFETRLKRASAVRARDSVITIDELSGRQWRYWLADQKLMRNDKILTHSELSVCSLTVSPYALPITSDSTIIPQGVQGLYRLYVVLRNKAGDTCKVNVVLRCPYEYWKSRP